MNTRYIPLHFVVIIVIAFIYIPVYGQTLYRANSGTNLTLRAVDFPDDSNGYIVGNSGAIVITSDGGNTWSIEPSGLSLNFYTEFFNDSANGAFAGDDGTIYTVLQDNAPIKVTLPESNPIYGMTFPSYDTGVVCGADGLFYMTTDSGKNWKKKTLMPQALQKITFYGTDYFDDDTYWIVGQDGLALYIFLTMEALQAGLSAINACFSRQTAATIGQAFQQPIVFVVLQAGTARMPMQSG